MSTKSDQTPKSLINNKNNKKIYKKNLRKFKKINLPCCIKRVVITHLWIHEPRQLLPSIRGFQYRVELEGMVKISTLLHHVCMYCRS
jgi:transcriptional regulatory protein LevR